MYAAAGGASLASRQARQKQRQNKKTEQLKQLKNQKGVDFSKAHHQFHNYTDPSVPKLSRVERGALKAPTQQERRHSTSNYHLKEPVHPKARIRESPSISIPVVPNHQLPHHPSAQPLTPCTLVQQQHHQQQQNHLESSPSVHSQLPQIFMPPEGDGKLERRCSFVRQVEEMEKHPEGGTGVLDRCNHICNFEIKERPWDTNLTYYSDFEAEGFGSLEYPFSECSQGRAAWQERERGRRCSLSEEARQHRIKQTEAHHRWMKRNRIHDSTYGTGSEEDDDFFNVYHQSAAANALLYVGLGTTAIGSVIFFVGTGEKGFKTLELRLIGPTLIACGLLCCLIRVLLCACPSTCLRRRKKTRLKDNCPHASSRYPLAPKLRDTQDNRDFIQVENSTLLGKHKKKVSIVPPNYSLPSTSTSEFKELPQQGTAYKQQEAAACKPTVIPQINLPLDLGDFGDHQEEAMMKREDSIIELQSLELCYDLESISSNDSEGITVIESDARQTTKLGRVREPANQNDEVVVEDIETCLSVVIERSDNSESSDGGLSLAKSKDSRDRDNSSGTKQQQQQPHHQTHSGVVLSPLQLGQ